jgi:hypothetical protein
MKKPRNAKNLTFKIQEIQLTFAVVPECIQVYFYLIASLSLSLYRISISSHLSDHFLFRIDTEFSRKMMCIKLIILIIFNLELIYSTRLFHHGGPMTKYKMLSLRAMEGVNQTTLPKEQWFQQKLDHFNPLDNRTWKQVN